MPSYRTVTVAEVLSERPGLSRLRVTSDAGDDERAYVLTDVTGPVAVGDEVVVNTTAVDLDLGTGGWHVVHWNLARREWSRPGAGHVMKVRYTSVQADTGVAEEHRPDLPTDLGGVPVVACSLHSQVGVVAAVLAHLVPAARIAYVATDGGALPLALSDLVAALRASGALVGSVTTGQAFGGDLEAASLPSGLAVARHLLAADALVVGMGPGVVGTGSRLGFSGLDQATALDAAEWLGGRPIACVRASSADGRPRHQGVSHHTTTALDATRSAVDVPVPPGLVVDDHRRHRVIEVEPPDVALVLSDLGLRITTMGRDVDDDPLFFAAAGAAAAHAASRLVGDPSP